MIRINLIPVRQVKKREAGRQQLVLFGAALIAVGAANYWWIDQVQGQLDRKKAQVGKLQSDIKQLEKVIGEVNSITKEKKALEDKLKVLETLKKRRAGPVKVMDALATLMPAHVWLNDVADHAGNWELKGMGMTNDDVAEFMRELKRSPYFKNIVLKKVSAVAVQSQGPVPEIVQFEISCSVNYAA
ncbi:MAG: PilN domain-containing protein [Myxococcales bacterium]